MSIRAIVVLAALLALSAAQKCKEAAEKGDQSKWILLHQACVACGAVCSSIDRPAFDAKSMKHGAKPTAKCGFRKKETLCGPRQNYLLPALNGGDQSATGVGCNAQVCNSDGAEFTKGQTCRVHNLDKGTKPNQKGLDVSHSKKCPPGTKQIAVAACSELKEYGPGKPSYQQEYVCKVTTKSIEFVEENAGSFGSKPLKGYYILDGVESKHHPAAHMLQVLEDEEYDDEYDDAGSMYAGFDDDGAHEEHDFVRATPSDSFLSSTGTGTQMLMFAMFSLSIILVCLCMGCLCGGVCGFMAYTAQKQIPTYSVVQSS